MPLLFTYIFYIAFALTCLFSTSALQAADKIKVAFINPDVKGRPFWDLTTEVAIAAADDLNIELSVYYGGGNRFSNLHLVEKLSTKPLKYDYLVFLPYRGKTKQQFQRLEQQGLPFVTLERSFEKAELASLGLPQQQFSMWRAEVYFDDKQAGYLLADTLIKQSGQIINNMIALSGDRSAISYQREQGLKLALQKHKQARLLQTTYTLWQTEAVEQQLPTLLKRHAKTNIIWAASDELALVAAQQLPPAQRINYKIGGIDLTQSALNAIQTGDLSVTVGGHFMQAAWALIKIHDMHHLTYQAAFDPSPLDVTFVTKQNIVQFEPLIKQPDWSKVNFKHFIQAPNTTQIYKFDLNLVIEQLLNQ